MKYIILLALLVMAGSLGCNPDGSIEKGKCGLCDAFGISKPGPNTIAVDWVEEKNIDGGSTFKK